MTIKNLISNDSGRYWDIDTDMRDMAVLAEDKTAFAIALDQQYPPGEYWEYNSPAIQTLEAVLHGGHRASRSSSSREEKLFEPLGMTSTILDDAAGNDLVFMGTQAGCLDVARFGAMILHDGAWEGDQIVSADWVAEATSASQDIMTGYGYLWCSFRSRLARVRATRRAQVPLDKRGIGLSDRFDGAPTLEERIQDIVAVMDAAGLGSATILGTSEGGLMAQLFTALHPERVERLLLVNSTPSVRQASWRSTPTRTDRIDRLVEDARTVPAARGDVGS